MLLLIIGTIYVPNLSHQSTSIWRWIRAMVSGAIGYLEKMPLTFIDTRMNAQLYQEMVAPHLPAYGYECAGLNWEFQQDNAPGQLWLVLRNVEFVYSRIGQQNRRV